MHIVIQHEHSPGGVFIHPLTYIDGIVLIIITLLIGKDDETLCEQDLHDMYRSVLGAVAWTVLTRADLAVYIQALQRKAHAPCIKDCKRMNIVIGYRNGIRVV